MTTPRNPFIQWLSQHAIAIITALAAAGGSYFTLQSEVKINTHQITQNREDIKQVRTEFLDQARKNEQAIKGLTQRIDTLIFKIADLKTKD